MFSRAIAHYPSGDYLFERVQGSIDAGEVAEVVHELSAELAPIARHTTLADEPVGSSTTIVLRDDDHWIGVTVDGAEDHDLDAAAAAPIASSLLPLPLRAGAPRGFGLAYQRLLATRPLRHRPVFTDEHYPGQRAIGALLGCARSD